MQFDATMSEVSAISGATGDEFDALRDKALEMGAKTKFSASEAGEAMTYMAMAGWKTGDMLGGIEGIMNLAAASGEDLATTSDIVTDALTAFGLQAGDSGHFADVLAKAASSANTNVGLLVAAFVTLWNNCEAFRNFWIGLWEGIKSVASAAVDGIKAAFDGIVDFFSGIVEGIKSAFDGIGEFLGGLFSDAWDAVKDAWGSAKEFFGDLWSNIKEKAGDAASNIRDKLKDAWNGIKSAWDNAKTFFGNLWSTIKEKGSEAAGKVKDAFGKAWDRIKSAWDGAMGFFGGVWEDIKGVFGNAWESFKEIGGNIVKGIWDGISGAAGWLWDQISGFFGSIVDNAKAALGIHSPSRVFAGIGENMALGLAEGWDDEYQSIKRQIESGLNFGTASIGVNTSYSGAQEAVGRPGTGWGNTYVTINSPEAVDGVQAARVWRKETQKMAIAYI